MSTFSAFNIGRLGLAAQARALQVTSNNISNVNTPGYTRQRAVFDPVTTGSTLAGNTAGGGVLVETVQRIADANIDAQLRHERQELSLDAGLESGLARIESIFEELDGSGISAALSEFFGSLNDLANDPASNTVRETVVRSAETLVGLIHDADRRLSDLQIDENARVEQSAREVSDIAGNIAQINQQILGKEVGGGTVASALRDRREVLMNELSELVDYTSFERPDGQVAIFAAGGFLLVDSDQAATLEVRTGAPGNPAFFDVFQNVGGSLNGPITSRISGGQLGASLSLRDDRVQAYRNALDEFSFTLADRINAVHHQPGTPPGALGLEDDVSRRFFVDLTQPVIAAGADFSQVSGAAAALTIHPDLVANSRNIAAGQGPGGGAPAAQSDNRVALALAGVEIQNGAFYTLTDPPGTPSAPAATLGAFFDGLSGALGSEIQSTRRSLAQEELIVAELEERRGAFSGVSLDEEVANLVRFERAYQASARILSTMDELLQSLIQI